jgi:hypothetical protein
VYVSLARLLAAELCALALVMLDTPCSELLWRILTTHCIRQFPLQFPSRASPCAITFQLHSIAVNFQYPYRLPSIQTPVLQHSHSILPNTNCLCLTHTYLFFATLKLSACSVASILHVFTWPTVDTIYWGYFLKTSGVTRNPFGGVVQQNQLRTEDREKGVWGLAL